MSSFENTHIEFVQIWKNETLLYEMNECIEPDLISKAYPTSEDYQITYKSSEASGIYMIYASPIKDENNRSIGCIRVGIQLANQSFVDNIKGITGSDATIFSGNKRFVTTIRRDGIYQTGTPMNTKVQEAILQKGLNYTGKMDILGEPYIVSYLPIFDSEGFPIGAFFVGKSITELHVFRIKLIGYISVLGILLLVIFYSISKRWVVKNISDPVYWVSNSMKEITEEDYHNFDHMPKPRSTELETLQSSMKIMVNSILDEKKKLKTVAYVDHLTGLPNRAALYHKYKDISMSRNKHTLSVIYYLDLDNLKYINHLFGQAVVDDLLHQVAMLLSEHIKTYQDHQIYRIAGDEFIICKEGGYSHEELANTSKNILALFEKNFIVEQYSISMTASIGVSYTSYCQGAQCDICEADCKDTLETLFKKAEAAINQVKATGKNNFILFDPIMNEQIQKKALMQQELKAALQNDELLLFYQPKYNIKKDCYDGFEALIRWKHPERGFVSPLEFISVAEESNLINEIGAWVLENACMFIKEFNQRYQKDFNVAVNVSVIQLFSDSFEETVCNALEKSQLDPIYLELEITESVFANSMDIVNEKLNFFREKNITIALDDFGTGYSSLTYLKTLPITTLKLDKTFVDDIAMNDVSLTIVESVIQIGKSTGLKIVVEGVETVEQLRILSSLQCDYIQGYYFSKPISVDCVHTLFKKAAVN